MARIGEIVTSRPVDVVFDNVADERNERREQEPVMRSFDSDTRGAAPGGLPEPVPVALIRSVPAVPAGSVSPCPA